MVGGNKRCKILRVKRHYKTHSKNHDCYQGESRKRKLESLKLARNKQTHMFKVSNESEDITNSSYKVSHILAGNMKPYSVGKIMK